MNFFSHLTGGNLVLNIPSSYGNGKLLKSRQPSGTPLQNFIQVKNKVDQVFHDVESYVHDTTNFLKVHRLELACARGFVPQSALTDINQYAASVSRIRNVLARDHMKVVFFGRTSNGKSTVINSMLHSRVLPSGMGHTTRCFIQVEPSPNEEKYILTGNSNEPQSLESIDNLTHALCSEGMAEDSLVRVLWPKNDSKLLKNEVVLVDSPGIDLSPELDNWIDKHCLDADVFVLVSNAESTLTQTEKNFLHRVNEKVSRPNVFILNNRWDASANEPEWSDKVRVQHTKQFLHFLVEELAVCSPEEAKRRIFFVSAREVLQHRLRNQGDVSSIMADGFQARMLEFEDFERQFELCISQSAIQTKFEAHIEKGKHIAKCLHEILKNLHSNVTIERDKSANNLDDKLSELRSSQKKYSEFLNDAKDTIAQLSAEVQHKVSNECDNEIMRLKEVVDNFLMPFTDVPSDITIYKKALVEHVDRTVISTLQNRCTGELLERIKDTENDMIASVAVILPSNFANELVRLRHHRDTFRLSFALHCHSFLDDFREDLQFRFSFGYAALYRRLSRIRNSFGSGAEIAPNTSREAEYWLIHKNVTYAVQGGVSFVLIGGLVFIVDWRIVAVGSTLYFGMYSYQHWSWNNRAKERELKRQLRIHLSSRLKQLSHTMTMNCESQVNREVNEVLNRLQRLIVEGHDVMEADVIKLQKDVDDLEKIAKCLTQMKGKAKFLCSDLDTVLSNVIFHKFSETHVLH